MLSTLQEVAAGGAVVAGGVFMGVLSTAAGDPAGVDVLLRELGPIGLAVAVLYRRVDKLEEQIAANSAVIDSLQ